MKRFLLRLLGALLWITDFENIMVYILIPVGLIAVGVMNEADWGYYVAAISIYAAILFALDHIFNKLADTGVKFLADWLKKRKK